MAKSEKKGSEKEKATPAKARIAKKAGEPDKGGKRLLYAAVFIIVVVVIVAGGLVYGLRNSSGQASFQQFQRNFNAAPRVAIYEQYSNASTYPYVIACGDSVIEQLGVSRVRNTSTIDFFVETNSTSCINKNGTNIGLQACMNYSAKEPSIFVGYNKSNSTIIKPNALYVTGDAKFLSECGIAAEITSG
ncbi:MAG: hypothetical protein LVQ95_01530 [Candidatus Micrarchaeales archaeon]|nr:hypothetical protein [Candidatus Micrarchaeales archaeon]